MENLLNRVKDQGGHLLNYKSPCFHFMQSEAIFKRILGEHQLSPSVGRPVCRPGKSCNCPQAEHSELYNVLKIARFAT